jgi:dTDP-4-dehydrorhamnose reductase
LGTENVVRAAADTGARLIHLSTDVLFNGRQAPYDEEAQPEPLHAYGRAKADAEAIVRECDDHVIVRTSLIYSLDEMDRATAGLVEALRNGQPYTLFADQRRNPVWVETLSRACVELAGSDFKGVLNVAGRQVLTRAEIGLRMLDWWGVKERETLSLLPSDSDKWPRDCELDLRRATSMLSTPLLGMDEVFEHVRQK